MSNTVWHRGPPPEIGWWPASRVHNIKTIRWCDGVRWSYPAYKWFTATQAAATAKLEYQYSEEIQWTERWWV